MIRKLRIKFILIVTVLMLGMLAGLFEVIYRSTQANGESESLQMMMTIAADPLGDNSPSQAGVYLPFFCVVQEPLPFDPSKSTFTLRGSDRYVNDEALVQRVMNAVVNGTATKGVLPEEGLRFYRQGSVKSRLVVVFMDISAEEATLEGLTRTFLLLGGGSVPVLLLLAFLLSLWMTKPVEKAWQQQRQFVSDASHELKTPLTVILTNAELLGTQSHSPEEQRRFTDNILSTSRQMRSLTERLLDLARADNGRLRQAFHTLDFSRLTYDAILPFEPVYFERNLQLHCHLQEALPVHGSSEHLQQVLDILLDNAAKYAFPNSWVQVILQKQGNYAQLSVATPGETISKADLKNIFKRFYRTDKARTGSGSYGLGLSIAESIVKEHRGKIRAESKGNINTFYVLLPLTRSRPESADPDPLST